MLVDQKMFMDDKNNVHLINKFDHSVAAEIARMTESEGGGRGKIGHVEYHVMGYVPPEMYNYDPWLIEATKAQRAGDTGEYTRLMKKFFEVHREFAPLIPKKYF